MTVSSRILTEAAEIVDRAEAREQRRQRAREVLADIQTGLCVLAIFAVITIWLVGLAASVRLLIGALS